MTTLFLPYHCPIFKTDHLLEPCQKNLARVKALKANHKPLGPLERCAECKGKMLETRPRTVIEGLPAPESWVEERFMNPDPPEYVRPEQKGWEPHPELTTAPLFLKDAKKEPEMRQLSPEKIAKVRKVVQGMAERYKRYKKEPKRPELPQLSPEKEETYHRIMAKQEEILPELPKTEDISEIDPHFTGEMSTEEYIRDMRGPKKEEIVQEAVKIAPVEVRYCPNHPEVPQRIDSLGRFMGMCQECLVERGRKCGLTAPPVAIPLNLQRYSELKAWLIEQADQNERTLQKEIMWRLKTAWRQG